MLAFAVVVFLTLPAGMSFARLYRRILNPQTLVLDIAITSIRMQIVIPPLPSLA